MKQRGKKKNANSLVIRGFKIRPFLNEQFCNICKSLRAHIHYEREREREEREREEGRHRRFSEDLKRM
jgi:hypothetical protein